MRHRAIAPARRLVAATLLAALVAACGGNDPNASTTTQPGVTTGETTATTEAPVLTNAPTTTNPEVKPVSGGSLIVGIDDDPTGFNPTADPWAAGGHNVARTIFDTLATYDAGGKVVPYLAEAITANADATVWTITLRSGITFHDGTPFDAAAVKANFDANKNSPQYGSQLALLTETKVVDPLTVELVMNQAWATFPNVLTGDVGSQIGYMAAPSMLAAPDGGLKPVGTGPFSFVEWVQDDHLTVRATTRTGRPPPISTTSPSSPSPTATRARRRSTPATSTSTARARRTRSPSTRPSPMTTASPSAPPVNPTW